MTATATPGAQNYVATAITFQATGTVTLNGGALAGVAMTATGAATCTTTNASGQYSCTLPYNYTGTVTPSLAGYTFSPAAGSYSNVTATPVAQNYTATAVTFQATGTVTLNGGPLAGVAMAATGAK